MKTYVRREYLRRASRILWEVLVRGSYSYTYDLMPLRSPPMPLRKRLNLLRAGLNLLRRRARPWGWPINLAVELTNACNLRCPVCPTGRGILNRKVTRLDMALYERLMDEAGPYLLGVMLWGWGEPLLHPEFGKAVAIARRHGVIPLVSTNGQNLDKPAIREELLADPPEHLIVALDGITEETNSRYRVGAVLERALAGVRALARAKKENGQTLPVLHLRFIVMNHNRHQIPELESFARANGFDFLSLRTLSIINDSESAHRDFVRSTGVFSAYQYSGNRRLGKGDFICDIAFGLPAVFADGTVVACDQDACASTPYGRISSTTSFADVWFGPEAARIRTSIWTAKGKPEFCKACPYKERRTNTCTVAAWDLRNGQSFAALPEVFAAEVAAESDPLQSVP